MYFLNPHGIMFGENAQLDVQGGFHASTADYLRLRDGGRFDARQPNNSILTVAPVEAFGFLTHTTAPLSVEGSLLFVHPEKTLSLIGGDLAINQAELVAPYGRINLASVAGIGEVIPKYDDFIVPALRGNITVQDSQISTNGEGSGAIYIRGGQFVLVNSQILGETLGNEDGGVIDIQADNLKLQGVIGTNTKGSGNGGAIVIKVADTLIASHSLIIASSQSKEVNGGDTGNIEIKARRIALTDRTKIDSSTSGTGKGGSIIIKVADILAILESSIVSNSLGKNIKAGNAGNINIKARQMMFKDNASLQNVTLGSGDGGSIVIEVDDILLFSGNSHIVGNSLGKGKAGRIEINASQITIISSKILGGSVSTKTDAGNAGDIKIEARQIIIDKTLIESTTSGVGQGGSITIKATDSLSIKNSSNINTNSLSTDSTGNAGNIYIEATQMALKEGSQITNNTNGSGKGGTITIKVSDNLIISGLDENEVRSGIGSSSTSRSANAGDAGQIDIHAKTVTLTKKAKIESMTQGHGNSGTIIIRANNVNLTNKSGISNTTLGSGEGNSIVIKVVDTLTLSDSNIFSNSGNYENRNTLGNAGSIDIEAHQVAITEGAGIKSMTGGFGNGGRIIIKADTLVISGKNENGNISGIFVNAVGTKTNAGDAGNIKIEANQMSLKNGIIQSATKGSGKGGTIILTGNNLTLVDSAAISSITHGSGKSGTIIIKVTDTLSLSGSDIVAHSGNNKINNTGNAGQIEIEARQVVMTNQAIIESNIFGLGKGGTIIMKVTDALNFSDSKIESNTYSTGVKASKGGNIDIEACQLTLTNGALISSSTLGNGEGGIIVINVRDTLTVSGRDKRGFSSGIVGNSQTTVTNAGKAGMITVQAHIINLTDGGAISTQTFNSAGGNITITPNLLLHLQKGGILTNVKGGDGDGGNITIQKPVFVVLDDAQIITKAKRGFGGDITINSQQFLSSADKNNVLDASSDVLERYGNIVITAPDEDISSNLIILSITPLDVDDLQKKSCEGLTRKDLSKLIVIDRDVPPPTPDNQKTHYIRRPNAPKPVKPLRRSSVIPEEQLF
jgi:large exoprotein involved in heme utilization and adhesion